MDESYYYKVKRSDLVDIADAIRAKRETTAPLIFPDEYKSEIRNIKAAPKYQQAKAGIAHVAHNISRTEISAYNPPYNMRQYVTEVTSGKNLSYSFPVNAGDWILATITSRSATTYPTGWTILHASPVLVNNGNHRMAVLCIQANTNETITFSATQATAERFYANFSVYSGINGFAYHEGTETLSDVYEAVIGEVTVARPVYPYLIWCCTAYRWLTSAPYNTWHCGDLKPICLDQNVYPPRQALFIDTDNDILQRVFSSYSSSAAAGGYIIDCVEVLTGGGET